MTKLCHSYLDVWAISNQSFCPLPISLEKILEYQYKVKYLGSNHFFPGYFFLKILSWIFTSMSIISRLNRTYFPFWFSRQLYWKFLLFFWTLWECLFWKFPLLIFRGKHIFFSILISDGIVLKLNNFTIELYGIALEICQFLYLDKTYFIYHPDFLGYVQLSISLLICA